MRSNWRALDGREQRLADGANDLLSCLWLSCTCFDHLRGTYNLLSSSSAVLHKILQLAFHSKLLCLLHLSCTKITPAYLLLMHAAFLFETLVITLALTGALNVMMHHHRSQSTAAFFSTKQCALFPFWAKNGLPHIMQCICILFHHYRCNLRNNATQNNYHIIRLRPCFHGSAIWIRVSFCEFNSLIRTEWETFREVLK